MSLSRSTTLMIPLAGVLLVGAAGAVLATSGDPAARSGAAPVPAAATPAPRAPAQGPGLGNPILRGVLDDLVAKGTITADQRAAILGGVAAKRDALRAERQAARQERKADRQQLRGFLSDGVITKDEFDQLPADSALRTAAGLMDDGKITLDELRQLGRDLVGAMGRGGMRGHGGFFGGGGWGPAASTSASPSTGG